MSEYEIHYIWIPCSKRLPEERRWYIVTLAGNVVDTAYYMADGVWGSSRGGILGANRVIAWTPFPESYKEEQ